MNIFTMNDRKQTCEKQIPLLSVLPAGWQCAKEKSNYIYIKFPKRSSCQPVRKITCVTLRYIDIKGIKTSTFISYTCTISIKSNQSRYVHIIIKIETAEETF